MRHCNTREKMRNTPDAYGHHAKDFEEGCEKEGPGGRYVVSLNAADRKFWMKVDDVNEECEDDFMDDCKVLDHLRMGMEDCADMHRDPCGNMTNESIPRSTMQTMSAMTPEESARIRCEKESMGSSMIGRHMRMKCKSCEHMCDSLCFDPCKHECVIIRKCSRCPHSCSSMCPDPCNHGCYKSKECKDMSMEHDSMCKEHNGMSMKNHHMSMEHDSMCKEHNGMSMKNHHMSMKNHHMSMNRQRHCELCDHECTPTCETNCIHECPSRHTSYQENGNMNGSVGGFTEVLHTPKLLQPYTTATTGLSDRTLSLINSLEPKIATRQMPQLGIWTLFTKVGCSNCERAKMLLSKNGQIYSFIDDETTTREQKKYLLEHSGQTKDTLTYPRIFLDDNLLGGYRELETHLMMSA